MPINRLFLIKASLLSGIAHQLIARPLGSSHKIALLPVASIWLNFWQPGADSSPQMMEQANGSLQSNYTNATAITIIA